MQIVKISISWNESILRLILPALALLWVYQTQNILKYIADFIIIER